MKIGIDARTLVKNRVGMGVYTHEIIKQLNYLDKENEYYLYSNKKIYIDFKLNPNWKICEYNSKIGTFWLYFILPKILNKDSIDIFWGTQHCLPKRNKFTKSIKYILTVHDLAILKIKRVGEWKNTIIQKIFLKRSCKSADKIIAVSKATKKDLIEILGLKNEKIDVVYEGTTPIEKSTSEVIDENKIIDKFDLKNKSYLFFLSTIEPRKNLDTVIKAFEIYKKDSKDDLKFIISGGIGWKCQKTLKMINNSEYKNDIIMTGYIEKTEKKILFENCVAFMYPSLYEGFGLPVLEAMQRGALVITSNISSLPEVGGNAAIYLNDVKNEKELENIIKNVVNMKLEDKQKYINEGYEQIKKFTWEDCAGQVLAEFKEK